ncbi:NADP oxidoreductase coenzyme F420-dependent [Seminavis robusta]|uniref:NADP oxidoreductase coenzyme F420-dependent n=1 Tax=Seminavis robusta TaxID=568900 RepID=A0A9N8HHY0_9STRA|nr:NADP oxidoreductase coenzyme F420-dependent [Seminavis robusta]|eukprot:Sro740_g195560.1 NADP oxidoreductase coenzyme F420-dependent (330) ;mRNA; f:27642-28742
MLPISFTLRLLFLVCLCFHGCYSFIIRSAPFLPRSFAQQSSSSTQLLLAAATSEPVKVGFVGCGTIAAAIATGLATQDTVAIDSISVSRRSKSKSQQLKESFPDLVKVYDDNQAILNQSDIIFLCVLPNLATQVLQDLEFDDSRHTLVSLVSTAKIDDLIYYSQLDKSRVAKMICLPAVARHQGVCLLCSPVPNPALEALFEAVGGVLALETEEELNVAMVTTCVMGPIYGVMAQSRDWLTQNCPSLSKSDASYLVAKQYQGAIQDAVIDCKDANRLDDLIEEQTPGGLNAQALKNWKTLGALGSYDKVMDAVLMRIEGKSDGSLWDVL